MLALDLEEMLALGEVGHKLLVGVVLPLGHE